MDNKNYNDEEYKLQDSTTESASHFAGAASNQDPAAATLEKTRRHHIFLIVFILFSSLGIFKEINSSISDSH